MFDISEINRYFLYIISPSIFGVSYWSVIVESADLSNIWYTLCWKLRASTVTIDRDGWKWGPLRYMYWNDQEDLSSLQYMYCTTEDELSVNLPDICILTIRDGSKWEPLWYCNNNGELKLGTFYVL